MENSTKLENDSGSFSIKKRLKSFIHAGRGIWVFIGGTHNAWVEIAIGVIAIVLGFYCKLSYIEWSILILAGGLVLVAEAFNTAIEIDINLTSPEYHPYARDTKDVAAGAVLICAIIWAVVTVIIFAHHI